jgi:hypothetical protein
VDRVGAKVVAKFVHLGHARFYQFLLTFSLQMIGSHTVVMNGLRKDPMADQTKVMATTAQTTANYRR